MLPKLFAVSLLTIALLAVPVSAHEDDSFEPFEVSCTVDYGTGIPGVGTLGFTILGNTFGTCGLGMTEEGETVSVHEISAAPGCSIQFDANGDNFSDGDVVLGAEYGGGTSFIVFCDVGVIDGENALTLHTVVEAA